MSGKVKVVLDEQTFASGFSKREFVLIEDSGKFPQDICFECVKEKISLLDELSEGDAVTVHFDIRGREYNGRYFNNLNAWKIDKGGVSDKESEGSGSAPASSGSPADMDDDIPF